MKPTSSTSQSTCDEYGKNNISLRLFFIFLNLNETSISYFLMELKKIDTQFPYIHLQSRCPSLRPFSVKEKMMIIKSRKLNFFPDVKIEIFFQIGYETTWKMRHENTNFIYWFFIWNFLCFNIHIHTHLQFSFDFTILHVRIGVFLAGFMHF
jgi:hypothetical protein